MRILDAVQHHTGEAVRFSEQHIAATPEHTPEVSIIIIFGLQ